MGCGKWPHSISTPPSAGSGDVVHRLLARTETVRHFVEASGEASVRGVQVFAL